MNTHGSVSFWSALEASPNVALGAGPELAQPIPGFRHFIRDPADAQRFAIDQVPFDPSSRPQRDHADDLMRKLAGLIQIEPAPPTFNPQVPSGFTYFLQLLAHDLVHSSLFLSRNQDNMLGLGNIRHMPLRLETLYGGGPTQCPFAYMNGAIGFPNQLRLGGVRQDGQTYKNTGDLRDIARARATEMMTQDKYPEALIVDARNDSHAILSQMVVLFHHLHNAIIKSLESNGPLPSTGNDFTDAQRRFAATQSACSLVYRSIIRNDLLPRILHPTVLDGYRSGRVPVLDVPKGLDENMWLVPLEFAFGFFRFGHAMIRAVYSFNPLTSIADRRGFPVTSIIEHTSDKSPEAMPFENIWTVDWQRFFGDDPTITNFSVRIGPWSRMDLENAIRGPYPHDEGLTFRDLSSSIATRPWSVRALTRELSKTHGDLIAQSPYVRGDPGSGPPPWFDAVKTWLSQRNRPGLEFPLTDDDIRILATDPPIPFFVRFEAGTDAAIGGTHLGVLASIVVADVFYGIFKYDRLMGINGGDNLAAQLKLLSEIVFDGRDDAFSGLDGLTTFNSLIAFLGNLIAFPTGRVVGSRKHPTRRR